MKFVCDKCRTKYTIADEKVHGKVLKIRCKNCGNIIEVREPGARPTAAASSTRKPTTKGALKAASRHGGSRKRSSAVAKVGPRGVSTRGQSKPGPGVGARADRSRPTPAALPRAGSRPGAGLAKRPAAPASRSPAPPPAEDPKTVVAAMPEEFLKELRGRGSSPLPAAPPDDDDGWFLGDDRGEYGPMTFAELAARCQRGEPGPNAEAWKEGFGDWRPLEEIPELKPYVKVAPPPRPVLGANPAPASPYTKSPQKDAVDRAPATPPKAPMPAKVTTAAPVDDSLVKIPKAVPESPPAPAEISWPELPPIQAADPTPPPMTAAEALAPEPFTPDNQVGTDAGPAGAHVSPGASQSSIVQLKQDRRPTLLIGLGVLLLSVAVVVLVVYLISSGKKPSKGSKTTTADSGMTMRPAPMRAATRPLPMEPMEPMAAMPAPMEADDSAEFDLDIDVTTGKVSRGMRKRRRRNGMKAPEPTETMRAASSGSLYGLPTMRSSFVGLMGFGTPMRSASGGSGGRPSDLGSVIKRNYSQLRRCYERAARMDSSIKSPKLRITVKVRSSGRCRSVYVSPSRHQANSLGICVRKRIKSWRWPKHGSDYRWTFSARFSSG